ncbi:MAG: xanthine dehydrogenase family protein subunit M [Thermoanaerobaculia bacterium]|nr:xanthine dehydrogenase family protein subunit M [Thermoanaerobaculia bacterium]
MFPASFDYYRAASVEDAVRLMAEHHEAKLIAGGHSLLPMMKLRLAEPLTLVDIARIAELQGLRHENGKVYVGALTTHWVLETSEILEAHCPLLKEAASKIGDPAVRNKGTIGGNIAHADPASDLPAVLVALGATIHLHGLDGHRAVPAEQFFLGLLHTDVQPGEILTLIELPEMHGASGHTGSCYLKFEHPASGYAICGAAAVVRKNADGTAAEVQLAFNGVTETPYFAQKVGASLVGAPLDDAVIDQAVNDGVLIDEPLGDVHASGLYRMELAKVFGKRALKIARDRAHG